VVAVLALAVAAFAVTAVLRNDAAVDPADASTVTASDPPKTAPPPTATTPSDDAGGGTATDSGTATATATATPEPIATTGAPAEPRSVAVVLTYAGYMPQSNTVIAGGYADTVAESDGTCTLTLTQDGQSREVSGPATPDAATTACGELAVPYDQLSSGTWQATVSYSSPQSTGTSSSTPVEVP